MKKRLLLIPVCGLLIAGAIRIGSYNTLKVNAEEEVVENVEPTEESFKEEAKAWLSQYLDEQMVANIISWAVDAGVLGALFGVYLKYRKYKANSIEDVINAVKGECGKYIEKSFKELSDKEIGNIVDCVKKLEESNETIMKVLVLMQDSTAKGKVALLEFLGSKTNNQEVIETAKQVEETIEQEQAKDQEIKDAVANDYEKIW